MGKAIRVSLVDADANRHKGTKAKSLEMRRCKSSVLAFATFNLPRERLPALSTKAAKNGSL